MISLAGCDEKVMCEAITGLGSGEKLSELASPPPPSSNEKIEESAIALTTAGAFQKIIRRERVLKLVTVIMVDSKLVGKYTVHQTS